MKLILFKFIATLTILATTATANAQDSQTNIEVARNISYDLEQVIRYARLNADAETATPGYGIDFELVAQALEKVKTGVDQITDYPVVIPVDPTTLKPIAEDYQN